MARKTRARKGTFSDVSLSVAKRYLYPASRRGMLLWGALAAVGLGAFAVADFHWRDARFLSNGPLSSSHAVLEGDCAACHAPFGEVTSDACSTCHEKVGDELGVYTFAAHYVYRSNDFQRVQTSEHETSCAGCHAEHLGREAQITRLGDGRCLPCHDYGSFNREHPAFELGRDDDALAFTHVHHTREVMERFGLADLERACLYCHNPRSDGESFEPLDFDRHCDACHLSASTATPRLAVADPQTGTPGVATLDDLLAGGEPGTRWALFANPNEYRRVGPLVSKSPVHHADPWVLENLRRLRREIYPDAGLAELLTTSPDLEAGDLREHYSEAVATLEDHALGLRSRPEPEVQTELQRIEALLAAVREALDDPVTPFDETELLLALDAAPRDLPAERAAEIGDLVDQLTAPCRPCHAVERATIARVRDDQDVMKRAEFNHRAHVLQVRCLECHAEIPVAEGILEETKGAETETDRAAIQNLPRIEVCRQCHRPEVSSNRCVTCHEFHPDKNRRSDLLLYRTEDDGAGPVAARSGP